MLSIVRFVRALLCVCVLSVVAWGQAVVAPAVVAPAVVAPAPAAKPTKMQLAQDVDAPGTMDDFFYTVVGGVEQVGLSSMPSETQPFVKLFLQSGSFSLVHLIPNSRMWGSIRLLGAPNQSDTQGIYSIFTDPTGQIQSSKLSSVGTAIDYAVGYSWRPTHWDTNNSVDVIVGFGATTPLQSNKVTSAYQIPVFGTVECNLVKNKFESSLSSLNIVSATGGVATGSTTACLQNNSAPTTTNGVTTYAPVTTLAFSNQDRTSFLLKDLVGVRMNHTARSQKDTLCADTSCYLGTIDFTFGMDAAITGGKFVGNRWVAKVDGVYPIRAGDTTTFYVFGSFSVRLARNKIDNQPLILNAVTIGNSGNGPSVPSVNTVVLPLTQPDRDFYRIGVGIDLLSLVKKKGS